MKIVFLLSIALANANIRDQLNCAQAHYVKWAGSNPEDYPSGLAYWGMDVWGMDGGRRKGADSYFPPEDRVRLNI